MPLGFAKSIFSKSAAAAAGNTHGFFATQATAVIKADMGTDQYATSGFTGCVWFRIDAGSDKTYTDQTGLDTWAASSTNEFGGSDGLVRIVSAQPALDDFYTENTGNAWAFALETSGTTMAQGFKARPDGFSGGGFVAEVGRTSGGAYENGSISRKSQFYQDFADGNWHCLIAHGNATPSQSGVYIDGTKYSDMLEFGQAASNDNISSFRYLFLGDRHTQSSDTFDNTTSNTFPGDIGPIWWDNSYIDVSNSTNMAKFYDAGNTDGYVHLGTDGTASGLSQPKIFIYQDGTSSLNLQSGGSASVSFTTIDTGSNSIVVGAGAGSGVSRSNRGAP